MNYIKIIFILTLILVTEGLYAQNDTLTGTITDSKSNVPIAYATIYLSQQGKGAYANEQGVFFVQFIGLEDTVIISAVGYEPDTFLINAYTFQNLNVQLKPIDYELETIEIHAEKQKAKRFTLGFFGKNPKANNIHCFAIGDQMAVYIQNQAEKQGIIEKIHFSTVECGSGNEEIINVNIRIKLWKYNVYSQLPEESLLIKDVIITFDKVKKKDFSVDILDQNIEFPPEGLFVGMEFLGNPNKAKSLQFIVGPAIQFAYVPKSILYTNRFGHNKWINWFVTDKRYKVPKIGLTLIEIE